MLKILLEDTALTSHDREMLDMSNCKICTQTSARYCEEEESFLKRTQKHEDNV
jgi:hypothetical protein